MSHTTDILGIGLYTPSEAALYARVSLGAMRRWLYGDGRGEAVLKPQLVGTCANFVTFLDFIQARNIGIIRREYNVPLPKIRKAIEIAEKEYGLQFPLARRHTVGLYGGELNIKLREGEMVQISGKEARRKLLHNIVEIYQKDLTFDSDGLADTFTAFRHPTPKGPVIVKMNPEIRFGEPLLPSCGYSARTLWEAVRAEGSIEAAADAYGVNADEIEAAHRYYDSLSLAV